MINLLEYTGMLVYIPKRCCVEGSGYLLGCIDVAHSVCCVTGLIPFSENKFRSLAAVNPLPCCTCGVIGTWTSDSDIALPVRSGVNNSCGVEPLLLFWRRADKLFVTWNHNNVYQQWSDVTDEFVIILYNSLHFSSSVVASENGFTSLADKAVLSNKHAILQAFYCHEQLCSTIEATKRTVSFVDFTCKEPNIITEVSSKASQFAVNFVSLVLTFCCYVCSFRFMNSQSMNSLISLPAIGCQSRHRYSAVKLRFEHVSSSSAHKLRFINILWLQAFDMLIGVVIMMWLLHDNKAVDMSNELLASAHMVASELEKLINWMMGVPAGLKLNPPLAYFLGHFFLYHIFLWKAYLNALKPVAGVVLSCACVTGCFGFSFQLAFVQDLLSMMTLHIYCFYVYAARLYNLQLNALSSLWRLFRGKKWNVLRKRVDSTTYNIDQLFLGTLLFTILLFLLPTTALFYAVFALLRIIILIVQGILSKLVAFINSLPVYWLVVRLINPAAVSGDLHMSVVQQSPLCLLIELKPVGVGRLFELNADVDSTQCTVRDPQNGSADNSVFSLLSKLISGRLIYPWIEPTSKH